MNTDVRGLDVASLLTVTWTIDERTEHDCTELSVVRRTARTSCCEHINGNVKRAPVCC